MPDRNREEIEKLEKLYAGNPAGRVFTHLAEAYRKAGELERSQDILDSGLRLHPDYPSAHVVLGRVKLDLGDKEEAAVAFRRVLELDRHNMVALRALGDMAVEAGRFEEARHYLGELVQIDPSDLELAEQLERLPPEVTAEEAIEALEVAVPDEAEAEPEAEPALVPEEPGEDVREEIGEPALELEMGSGMLVESAADASAAPGEPAAAGAEPDSEPEAPAVPVQEDAEDAGEQDRAAAPLDAWVESLNVLDPESIGASLPGQPVEVPDDSGGRDAEPSEESSALDEPIEVSDDEEEDAFEGVVEVIVPDSEDAGPETDEDVLTLEAVQLDDEEESGEDTGADVVAAEAEAPEPDVTAAADAEAADDADIGDVEAQPEEDTTWLGDPAMHTKVPDPVEWVSQEDWERIAAHAPWTEREDSEGAVEAVPPIEPEWGEEGRDEDADEVATETLAEVYAAQGFRQEAAEIYRKLLRRRPEDARLLTRLAELEGEADETGPEGAGTAGETPGTTAGAETGEATWPGGEEPAEAGPTPYAWMEAGVAAEPDEGETIGDHLRAVLAWQPEARPEPEPEPTLLLEEVAEEPPGGFPDFGADVEQEEPAPAAADPETEDLEMFRSWLKSLRK